MTNRTDTLLAGLELERMKGLELGPLVNPVVTRSMGDIRYLDHLDTDGLRARYADDVNLDVSAIVPIDYSLDGRTIREAVGDDAPFDYVVASHVIEHVPNLIGWLTEIRQVLADDGLLTLAIPDHRHCFDALRSPTVAADVVEAHLAKATVPSSRQVFDFFASSVFWRGTMSWSEDVDSAELAPAHTEREALERAAAVHETGAYDDVHCWVFTPRSFCRLFASLQHLELVPFDVVTCSETVGGEFFATLRPSDPTTSSAPPFGEDLRRSSEAAVVRAEHDRDQRELQAVRLERDAMVASRSWQVTRPLRAFNTWRAARSGR